MTHVNPNSEPLCLEFANTAHWHASDHPQETLHGYSDLVSWAEQAGIVTAQEAGLLMHEAQRQPDRAAEVWRQGIELREAIYRVFSYLTHGQAAAQTNVGILNAALAEALSHAKIVESEDGFVWAWAAEAAALDRVLWPVARSAADLLTSAELLPRVGQCADDRGCGWLFVDMSKNRSRRWCDINDCGNRAKQRRHYQRVRPRAPGGTRFARET